jgi:hypothetical protein
MGVDFNIQDSNPTNDDVVTGQPNGNGNDTNGSPIFVSAASVTPDPTVSATYTNFPQEFRFVYANVPRNGTATIAVRLKEYGTSVYTNHYTLLSATVNTLAPTQIVEFSSPATNNTILNYSSNLTYIVQACFSPTLNFSTNNFNLLINGVLQPQAAYVLRHANLIAACPGNASLTYSWNNPAPGTNLIQLIYTNAGVTLSDSRMMIVASPPVISGLSNNHQQVVWQSAPGVNYAVLATTNLLQPFQNISGAVPSSGATSFYTDTNPASQKFYEIMITP